MFIGAIYIVDATQSHAAIIERVERLTATAVVSAPSSRTFGRRRRTGKRGRGPR